MIEQPLRAIGEREAVYPAWEIPQRWFGHTEVTKRSSQGVLTTIVTEVVSHVFALLPCGCKVSQKEQCGGVCSWCYAELDEQRAQGVLPPFITLHQQEWMATPCREHFAICSYPLCMFGLCPRHALPGPTDKLFCPIHCDMAVYEHKLGEIASSKGVLYAKGYDFFKVLFFNKNAAK